MNQRSLTIVVFVSLALNLFLVGAIAGGLVVGHRFRNDGPPPSARNVQPIWRAGEMLPPDQARAYHMALRGQGREARDAMRTARAARQEAWRELGQEPFDASALKGRLATIRAREADARGHIEDGIVDFAAGLSPTERTALARGLTAGRPSPHSPGPANERPN